jgi:hypothetical protein
VDIFVDTKIPFIADKMKLASWQWHRRWLNFLGSAVGWTAAYYFVFYRLVPLRTYVFKSEHIAILLIALLGIVGFLPLTLSLVPTTLSTLVTTLGNIASPKKAD